MLFGLGSVALLVVLILVIGGAAALGTLIGTTLRRRGVGHHEPVGVVQATLLGFLGLLLAFGLTMAVGRYDARRASVVEEANDIGTTYLRAQVLAEPERSASMELLVQYTDAAIGMADEVPDDSRFESDLATIDALQSELWSNAASAVHAEPMGTAPKLYMESLNSMIDSHTVRVASLRNRVPTTVQMLQVVGSAVAIGVLALYLALLGRGALTSMVAAGVVILILFICFDLDRPQRGLITVPFAPLTEVRELMDSPPAAGP